MFNICCSVPVVDDHNRHEQLGLEASQDESTPRRSRRSTIAHCQNLSKHRQQTHALQSHNNYFKPPLLENFKRNEYPVSFRIIPSVSERKEDGREYVDSVKIQKQRKNEAVTIRTVIARQGKKAILEQARRGTGKLDRHRPHVLIAKQKPQYRLLCGDMINMEEINRPSSAMNCYVNDSKMVKQNAEQIYMQSNSCNYLKRTKKKQPIYDARCSKNTNSNRSIIADRAVMETKLTNPFVYENNFIINITQKPSNQSLFTLPSHQSLPFSPNKKKQLLQDVKTIVSGEGSIRSSRISELKVQQSMLVERVMDMFNFVTPLGGPNCCLMQKAVDRQRNQAVVLKRFGSEMEEEYLRELEIFGMVEGLGRTLGLKQVLVQDNIIGKGVVFVFNHYDMTLVQMIRSKVLVKDIPYFAASFVQEVKQFCITLQKNRIKLCKPLKLGDFLWHSGWRLRCLCKFNAAKAKVDGFEWINHLRKQVEELGRV